MCRRVLEEDDARRDLHAALDELEDRSLARDVCAPFRTATLDVVESAERVEVVVLVVIEGCLVTQAFPHGVGIGVDLEVVRVVVQLAVGCARHGDRPCRSRQPVGPLGNFSNDPASTRICCPVMYRDSSLARKSARLAMSSGST